MKDKKKVQKLLSILLALMLLAGCTSGNASEPTEDAQVQEILRALAPRNQSFEPGDSQLQLTASFPAPEEKENTLLVYMIGSNLESQLGKATRDLQEMRGSGVNFEKNNVIVYTGGEQANDVV